MDSNRRPLSPAAIARIQQSYGQIAHGQTLARLFYKRLFEKNPAARSLFPEDMIQQHAHFTVAIAVLVWNLDHLDGLRDPLRELGARHTGYGVRREHFVDFRDVLLEVLAECAGDFWTPQLREDWWEALTHVIAIVLDSVPESHRGAADELRST